jgi:hypothetical protein
MGRKVKKRTPAKVSKLNSGQAITAIRLQRAFPQELRLAQELKAEQQVLA